MEQKNPFRVSWKTVRTLEASGCIVVTRKQNGTALEYALPHQNEDDTPSQVDTSSQPGLTTPQPDRKPITETERAPIQESWASVPSTEVDLFATLADKKNKEEERQDTRRSLQYA